MRVTLAGQATTHSIIAALSLSCVVAELAAAQVQQAGTPKLTAPLADVRSALDKYRDPLVAVHDGFFSTVACIDFPHGGNHGGVDYKPGAMGVHFLNTSNMGPVPDPAKPQILIYEPAGDKLRLVAAEWLVPAELVKDGKAPTIFGQTMQGPMDGHQPVMPAALRHYDLHVWLWKDNPHGVFEPTNTKVKCPKTGYTHREGASHKH